MKILISLLLFFSPALYAGSGIVLVLESPIYHEPTRDSQVVQAVRKGQKVFIHDKHFFGSPVSPAYGNNQKTIEDDLGFYETATKTGGIGYIPKEFVKLIYNDEREYSQAISPFENDPTDYRLEEPLPKGYPIIDSRKLRALFQITLGSSPKENYYYPSTFENESYTPQVGASFTYASKVAWDKYNRFYFGAQFQIYTSKASFTLFDGSYAEEIKGVLGGGPYISYDVFRNDDYRFTIANSIMLDWKRNIVGRAKTDAYKEERIFSAYTVSTKFSGYFAKKKVFGESIDFILGAEFQIFAPHALTTHAPIETSEAWNEERDQIRFGIDGNLTYFIGFQSNY